MDINYFTEMFFHFPFRNLIEITTCIMFQCDKILLLELEYRLIYFKGKFI